STKSQPSAHAIVLSFGGASLSPHLPSIASWINAELGVEDAVEMREVTETAVEGDVDDAPRLGCQTQGRLAQAQPQNVLVRRNTCDALEGAQEMVRAQAGLGSKFGDRQAASIGEALERQRDPALDLPRGPRHPRLGIGRGSRIGAGDALGEL